jgi:hypothetical protein
MDTARVRRLLVLARVLRAFATERWPYPVPAYVRLELDRLVIDGEVAITTEQCRALCWLFGLNPPTFSGDDDVAVWSVEPIVGQSGDGSRT